MSDRNRQYIQSRKYDMQTVRPSPAFQASKRFMHTNETSQRIPESQADAPRATACVVRITSGSLPILGWHPVYMCSMI